MAGECDPRDGGTRWHHLDEKNVQRAVRNAVRRAGIHRDGLLPYLSTLLCHLS